MTTNFLPNSAHRYIGRFAPSPTGPLHIGSLVTAMAGYLDAKLHQGDWLLRIEDVDTPRTVKGVAAGFQRDLEALGFEWTGTVAFQHERTDLYLEAIKRLNELPSQLFLCNCSRTDQPSNLYDGRCRQRSLLNHDGPAPDGFAIRLRAQQQIVWHDRSGLRRDENLKESCGDFVLFRRDKLWAYQLAVVVDDAHQGITHIVRGDDLLGSTSRQIYLQRLLGYRVPSYWHIPVILSEDGQKLSKQTGAQAIDVSNKEAILETLHLAWNLLLTQIHTDNKSQATALEVNFSSVTEFWTTRLNVVEELGLFPAA